MTTDFTVMADDELAQRRIDLEFRLALSVGKPANNEILTMTNELRSVIAEINKRAKQTLMQTTGNLTEEDSYNSVVASAPKSY